MILMVKGFSCFLGLFGYVLAMFRVVSGFGLSGQLSRSGIYSEIG